MTDELTQELTTDQDESIGALTKDVETAMDMKQFFSFLKVDMDEYGDFIKTISPAVAKRLKRHLIGLRTGTHAVVPLICPAGYKCPIVKRCPFTVFDADGNIDGKQSKWPILRACPVEKDVLYWRIQGYAEEYELDITSPSTVALVTKLAELDIYEMRCDIMLSSGDRDEQGQDLLREDVTAVDPKTGTIFRTLKQHPAWEIKKDIHRQRMELLDVLLGTPKSKIKALKDSGKKDEGPPSDLIADMARLRAHIDTINKENAIEASYEED